MVIYKKNTPKWRPCTSSRIITRNKFEILDILPEENYGKNTLNTNGNQLSNTHSRVKILKKTTYKCL